MISYGGYDGTGKYPFARRCIRIVIVYCAAARVKTVYCVSCGGIGAVGYRLVKLPVIYAGKGVFLIYNPRKRIGKRGMLYAV